MVKPTEQPEQRPETSDKEVQGQLRSDASVPPLTFQQLQELHAISPETIQALIRGHRIEQETTARAAQQALPAVSGVTMTQSMPALNLQQQTFNAQHFQVLQAQAQAQARAQPEDQICAQGEGQARAQADAEAKAKAEAAQQLRVQQQQELAQYAQFGMAFQKVRQTLLLTFPIGISNVIRHLQQLMPPLLNMCGTSAALPPAPCPGTATTAGALDATFYENIILEAQTKALNEELVKMIRSYDQTQQEEKALMFEQIQILNMLSENGGGPAEQLLHRLLVNRQKESGLERERLQMMMDESAKTFVKILSTPLNVLSGLTNAETDILREILETEHEHIQRVIAKNELFKQQTQQALLALNQHTLHASNLLEEQTSGGTAASGVGGIVSRQFVTAALAAFQQPQLQQQQATPTSPHPHGDGDGHVGGDDGGGKRKMNDAATSATASKRSATSSQAANVAGPVDASIASAALDGASGN